MIIKGKKINCSEYLPYALVIATLAILGFGFDRFLVQREVEKNVDITRSISNSIIIAEHYIENNLKCATGYLHEYLKHNPLPKKAIDLKNIKQSAVVDNFEIYNKDGHVIFGTSGELELNPLSFVSYSKFDVCPKQKLMKNEVYAIDLQPFFQTISVDNGRKSYHDKCGSAWFKDSQQFLNAYIDVSFIQQVMRSSISNLRIKDISVLSPSGVVLMSSQYNHANGDRVVMQDTIFNSYNEIPQIKISFDAINVLTPFGGLKNSCGTLQNDKSEYTGLANSKGQYFYVMNVTFSKTVLNIQLWVLRGIFMALTLLSCLAIYYKQKLIKQSKDHSGTVVDLCNTRLGEVRRYVTKLLKDDMRFKNAEKELSIDMADFLEEAFEKFENSKGKN